MTDTFRKKYNDDASLKEFANEIKTLADNVQEHLLMINPERDVQFL